MIFLPHIIGAPKPLLEAGTAPINILYEFINAAYITNGIFWIILGMTTIFIFSKYKNKFDCK